MTKAKNETQDHADRVNCVDIATTESNLIVSLTEDQNHVAECQPAREQPCDEFHKSVRELAHCKWEMAGFPPGDGLDFWLEAEREVKANRAASDAAPE